MPNASFGTNAVTVARNSSLIQGSADDLTLDLNGAIVTLIYTGATYGWVQVLYNIFIILHL